jgi:membrane-associated PAP2 superfamily phosphatase
LPAGDSAVTPAPHRLTAVTVALIAGLAAIVAWDLSGLDLAVGRLFGTAQGFALRDDFWVSAVLHDGLRHVAVAVLVGLIVRTALLPRGHPDRAHEARWLAVVTLTALVVPLLKRLSATSCPWDLAEFGGAWPYVPHHGPGPGDGGPGHCFPSGHAVSAFGFFGIYFMWREPHPRRARAALALALVLGVLAGYAQVARGAHHVSHVLWTAWVCWAVPWAAARLAWFRMPQLRGAPARCRSAARPRADPAANTARSPHRLRDRPGRR